MNYINNEFHTQYNFKHSYTCYCHESTISKYEINKIKNIVIKHLSSIDIYNSISTVSISLM
jgi:hypothetical protein